ncbi:MAG: hypothetical protein KC503_44865 [Myxococcales bacterium]|nr:hypothetical protein [Myxococcales bacterium]
MFRRLAALAVLALASTGCKQRAPDAGAASSAPRVARGGSSKDAPKADARAGKGTASASSAASVPPSIAGQHEPTVALSFQPGHTMRDLELVGWTRDGRYLVIDAVYGRRAGGRLTKARYEARQVRDLLTGALVESFYTWRASGPRAEDETDRIRSARTASESLREWKLWALRHPFFKAAPAQRDQHLALAVARPVPGLVLGTDGRGATYRWRASKQRPRFEVRLRDRDLLRFAVPFHMPSITTRDEVFGRVELRRLPGGKRALLVLRARAKGHQDARFYLRSFGPQIELVCARYEEQRARKLAAELLRRGLPVVKLVLADDEAIPSKTEVSYRRDSRKTAAAVAAALHGKKVAIRELQSNGWVDVVARLAPLTSAPKPCVGPSNPSLGGAYRDGRRGVTFRLDEPRLHWSYRYDVENDRFVRTRWRTDKASSEHTSKVTREVKRCASDGRCATKKIAASTVRPDGRWFFVTRGQEDRTVVDIYDAKSGRKQSTVAAGEGCKNALWLHDLLYVENNVCAGPGGEAAIYDPETGKKRHDVGTKLFNCYGCKPLDLGGDRWLVVQAMGDSLAVQNMRSGKVLASVKLEYTVSHNQTWVARFAKGLVVVQSPSRETVAATVRLVTLGGKVTKLRELPRCK